ncbi:MAG: hypothetical protein V1799_15035 [bacterium]
MTHIVRSSSLLFILCIIPLPALSQNIGEYRSSVSGDWSKATTWQQFDGTTWKAALTPPDSVSHEVTIV